MINKTFPITKSKTTSWPQSKKMSWKKKTGNSRSSWKQWTKTKRRQPSTRSCSRRNLSHHLPERSKVMHSTFKICEDSLKASQTIISDSKIKLSLSRTTNPAATPVAREVNRNQATVSDQDHRSLLRRNRNSWTLQIQNLPRPKTTRRNCRTKYRCTKCRSKSSSRSNSRMRRTRRPCFRLQPCPRRICRCNCGRSLRINYRVRNLSRSRKYRTNDDWFKRSRREVK